MRDLFLNSFITLYVILGFSCQSGIGQENVALRMTYFLSDKPNFKNTATSEVGKILTDGVIGNYNKNILGWKDSDEIEIELDLKKNQNLSQIKADVAFDNDARIYLPQNVFIFASMDKKNYTYVGDMLANFKPTKQNKGIANLSISGVKANGRYVKFFIVPNKNYFLLSEIQIFNKKLGGENVSNKSMVASEIRPFILNLLDRDRIVFKLSDNSTQFNRSKGEKTGGVVIKEIEYNSLPLAKKPLLSTSSVNQMVGIVNEYCYKLLLVANNSKQKTVLRSDFSKQRAFSVRFYKGVPVSNTRYKDVIDALEPINGTNIELLPGEESYFLLKFKFNKVGPFTGNINFSNITKDISVNIPVVAKIISKPKTKALNAINWPYFDLPQIKDVKKVAINDLKDHGINTYPVARNILAKIKNDKRSFVSYFEGIDKSSRLLLFFGFNKEDAKKIADSKSKYLSNEWKGSFKAYLENIYNTLNTMGYKNIYIYPYDEISSKDFQEFQSLTNWLRNDLSYRCYATVLHENMVRAGNFVDIVQYNTLALKGNKSFVNISGEKWLYEIFWYSRDVNPMEYRLLAWKAYSNGFTGVGFWNYSKTTLSQNTPNSTYLNGRQDHSVIYNGKNGNLLSSFRWESFYLGMQDYLKLRSLEEIKGKEYVRKIVLKMLSSTSDNEKNQILTNLNKEFID